MPEDQVLRESIRARFVPEICLPVQEGLPFLRDLVVFPIPRDRLDEISGFELWDTAVQGSIGDIHISVVEVIRDSLFVVGSSAVLEKLQNHVITGSHPICPEPRHITFPEDPIHTVFDLFYSRPIIAHSGILLAQCLLLMGQDCFTTDDAALLGVVDSRKTGSTPVLHHGRRVGPWRTVLWQTNPGLKNIPGLRRLGTDFQIVARRAAPRSTGSLRTVPACGGPPLADTGFRVR